MLGGVGRPGQAADCVAGGRRLWEGLALQQGPPCPSHHIPTPLSPASTELVGPPQAGRGAFQRRPARPPARGPPRAHPPARVRVLASELSSRAPHSCSGGRRCPWLPTPSPRVSAPTQDQAGPRFCSSLCRAGRAVTESRAQGPWGPGQTGGRLRPPTGPGPRLTGRESRSTRRRDLRRHGPSCHGRGVPESQPLTGPSGRRGDGRGPAPAHSQGKPGAEPTLCALNSRARPPAATGPLHGSVCPAGLSLLRVLSLHISWGPWASLS